MSMDPTKWAPFDRLSEGTRERVQQYYPYLKLDHCVFQEKDSGVYMKAVNNVKIEKLLDPLKPGAPAPSATSAPAPATPAATKPASGGRTRKASA